ncbi:MAG TPA: hypothetical protein VKU62_06690 [Thermoanaerobaculia bacterium]|nr:hypothetical protein [Thermoanaerobaculia bacterium]
MSAEEFLELCVARNLKIVLVEIDDLTPDEAIDSLIRAVKRVDEMVDA